MSPGFLGKIALGSGASIGTAATGLGIYRLINKPTTIGEELKQEEGIDLLEDSYSEWQKLIDKHKTTETQKGKVPTKIEGLSITDDSSNQGNKQLQEKCKELWNTKLSDTKSEDITRKKEEIRTWCATDPKALKVLES